MSLFSSLSIIHQCLFSVSVLRKKNFINKCLVEICNIHGCAHTYVKPHIHIWGFPGSSVAKDPPASAGDTGSIPGSERSPGEGNGNPLQYSYLGSPTDRGAWWATVHGITRVGHKLVTKWASLVAQRVKYLPAMQETQVQSLGREDALEKEMATHSSILAWRIPWTEEPGRLQSTG